MSLFEIVGLTSNVMTYNVGFAFLTGEREGNFTWALQVCVNMLKCKKNGEGNYYCQGHHNDECCYQKGNYY